MHPGPGCFISLRDRHAGFRLPKDFSDLEYAAKKKVTQRDRFFGKIDAVTPWPALLAKLEPFYPKSKGRGQSSVGLERMLRMYIAQQCFGLSD